MKTLNKLVLIGFVIVAVAVNTVNSVNKISIKSIDALLRFAKKAAFVQKAKVSVSEDRLSVKTKIEDSQ